MVKEIIQFFGVVFVIIAVLADFRANRETGSIAMKASLIGSILLLFGVFLIMMPQFIIDISQRVLNFLF